MRYVLDSLIDALEKGDSVILGGIVQSSGSAPRTSGARMLVLADGSLVGSVGGGLVEGACHAEAKKLLTDTQPCKEMRFDLSAADAAREGMVCGGAVRVLLHRVDPQELPRFAALQQVYQAGQRPVLLTKLPNKEMPSQLMMLGTGHDHEIPAQLREQVASKQKRVSYSLTMDDQEIFVEPLTKSGTVHLAGAGHVALAVADLASYVGFETVVMDDRQEFANHDRYPQAKEIRIIEGFANCFDGLESDDFVVIVTRGHQYDLDVLAQALRTKAGYIGMIGSSKKRKAVYGALKAQGFSQQDIDRVHSPIGLEIGSDTPQEIGLSIVAELVKVRAGMKQ